MATLVKQPYHCTFIHIPKTGGNSITDWLKANFNAQVSKGKQHANIIEAQTRLGDLGFTYCTVRNPWDYAVSWYTFRIYLCKAYLKTAEENPELVKKKKKLNPEVNRQQLAELEKGFGYYLERMGRSQQHKWAGACDYVMKLENINEDFKVIQDKLNCHEPLGIANKTPNRTAYRDYYTDQKLIDIVAEKFKDDIEVYGYEF